MQESKAQNDLLIYWPYFDVAAGKGKIFNHIGVNKDAGWFDSHPISDFSKQPETIEDAAPTLALRDISSSSITSMRLSAKDIPTLTIGSDGNSYKISLDFTAAQLSETEAIGLITGFAARMDDPLHHLL